MNLADFVDLIFDPYAESAIWGALARREIARGDAALASAWAQNAATIARLILSRRAIPHSIFGAWRSVVNAPRA
jgi:hypothetical protein